MTDDYLSIRSIRKTYGPVTAVHEVSLDIRQGEFLTFLGPSGSGKSTTLYIVAGFQNPTSGDITLNGRTLLTVPSHKRNIGMVFQRYTLFPHLSVGDNIAFPLKVRKRDKAEITEKVRKVLKLVRLEGFEDRMPAMMSGGQQQRVALARALVYDPPVLLMDEPLSALDKKLREEVQFEIRRIHRETGVTILYVTHDQEEALRLSDRIAVFNHGRIDQVGTGEMLYSEPASRFVAEFVGDSNFLDCELLSVEGGSAKVRIGTGQVFEGIRLHGNGRPGGRAALMVRPERLVPVGSGNAPECGFEGLIKDLTFLGNHTDISIETGAGPLSCRLPVGVGLASAGSAKPIRVAFDKEHAHVFS